MLRQRWSLKYFVLVTEVGFTDLLAMPVPMKPFDPNTVTTSPEKDDLPPRPLFMPAVLSWPRTRTSDDMGDPDMEQVTRGTGLSSAPLRDRAAIVRVSETRDNLENRSNFKKAFALWKFSVFRKKAKIGTTKETGELCQQHWCYHLRKKNPVYN